MDNLKLKIRFTDKLKQLQTNNYHQNLLYHHYFESWRQHMLENNMQTLLQYCSEQRYSDASEFIYNVQLDTYMINFMNDLIKL